MTTQKQPKLLMVANCGYPERSQFQVISHWFQRHARNLGTEIAGEIYASEGALLSSQAPGLQPIIAKYLEAVEKAGHEVASRMKISRATKRLLERSFIPHDVYIQGVKQYVDAMMKPENV